jgi:ribosome-associated toxin RatA of RatAB toxin-antitoxin module
MKALGSSVVAALTALIFLFQSATSYSITFTPSEIESLQAGKTVRKPLSTSRQNGFYGGTGFVIVDASPGVIWAALQDWDSYPRIFPRTVSTKKVAYDGKQSLINMELGYKILTVKYSISVLPDPEKQTVTFSLARNRPHDIESTHGYWRLFPQKDGRTLVAYAIAVKVPAGIVNFLGDELENKLERYLLGLPKYLKEWVESPSGSRYREMVAKK